MRRQPVIHRSRRLSRPAGQPPRADSPSAVAYSHCMRSHGVPDFPDPAATAAARRPARSTRGQQLPVPGGRRTPASTCSRPASFQQQAQQCLQAGDCPQALVQQMLTADRSSPGACAPTGCPTGPTPPSIPRGALSSTSSRPASPTARRIRRRSRQAAECQRLDPAPAALERRARRQPVVGDVTRGSGSHRPGAEPRGLADDCARSCRPRSPSACAPRRARLPMIAGRSKALRQ